MNRAAVDGGRQVNPVELALTRYVADVGLGLTV